VRKYFVETKRPSINLKEDPEPAYQLRRYAWSAKLPLSVLTDFEEFCVYNCRVRPQKTDKASKERVLYITWDEYLDRWDEIADIFSRDAILRGAFDKYAESKKKRGTAEVDEAFLKEIEGWREVLARNLALRNPALSQRELNYAVQKTIDRIIFLRICEDRGIEPADRLRAVTNGPHLYGRLCQLFRAADDRYNSGLFHFQREKGRPEDPDEWTLDLAIDDKPLKDIITGLYYPDSPYEFSVLPADILGQVYEQFLGKVIRLTKGHQARVEEKPEVRKAGGVYYTPTYIVDYIVANTVGKLLEGKTAFDVAARTKAWRPAKQGRPLTVLDPACGSGSFLIGAYQYLLDWYRDWYAAHDPDHWLRLKDPTICETVAPAGMPPTPAIQNPKSKIQNGSTFRLTTSEKKRILLDHIFGVDIDAQAVEVTKLSLLLKVLEGETRETLQRQLFARERALPDLGNNIKCGNSLIGPDFYDGQQLGMFDEEELLRINAFDWDAEFPAIMQGGGFDAVIGNPPYVFGRDWNALNISPNVKSYLASHYGTSPYQMDMFSIFMEKAFYLARDGGRIGQIVPNVWLTNTYSSTTRAYYLARATELRLLVPPPRVFPGITVDTIVYVLEKGNSPSDWIIVERMPSPHTIEPIGQFQTQQYLSGKRPISTAVSPDASTLLDRLRQENPKLGEIASITRGVHPYRTGGYGQTAFGSGPQTKRDVAERPYHQKAPALGCRPFIYGRDLRRYGTLKPGDYVKYGPWLAEPRDPAFFQGPRIYSRKILADRLIATMESGDSVADQQVYITRVVHGAVAPEYVLGILASRLTAFFIRAYFDEATSAFPQIKVRQLRELPIRTADSRDRADIAGHDRMVELVNLMLALQRQLTEATTGHQQTALKRRIDATDAQIDRMVYNLYGLTDDDIRLVEEGTGRRSYRETSSSQKRS
jgi:hypothetical protein